MKTFAEMRARLAEQTSQAESEFNCRRDYITAKWILAFEEKLEWAYASKDPVHEVAVYTNALDIFENYPLPEPEGVLVAAAELVRHHFLNAGFNAWSPHVISDRNVGVTIYWS